MPKRILLNKPQIQSLYLSGLSQKEIAIKLGVSLPTLHRRCREFNVEARSKSEEMHNRQQKHCIINKELTDVINGLLLSDGHLRGKQKSKKSLYSSIFDVCMKYADVPDYLSILFDKHNIQYRRITRDRYDKRTLSTYHCEEITTRSYVEFLDIREKWYKDNKKIVPIDLELNPVVLYFWMIGDGYNAVNARIPGHHIQLATMGFDKKHNLLLVQKLKTYFKSDAITLPKDNTIHILSSLFHQFILECQKAKIDLLTYRYKMRTEFANG